MSLGEDALVEIVCAEVGYKATKNMYYQKIRDRLNSSKMKWIDKNNHIIDLYTIDEDYFSNIVRFYERETKSQFPSRVILNYMYFRMFGIKIDFDKDEVANESKRIN